MPDRGKIRLLLVEDEQDLAEVISDTLSGKGFTVRIAHNGAEAIEAVSGYKADIIVTDIMMPVMDGFTFVKKLRTTDKDTPVLFLSARSGAEDVVKGFETGAGDYIRKPFAISELIVRINSLLERKTGNGNAGIYEIGRFTFDPNDRTLYDGNRSVPPSVAAATCFPSQQTPGIERFYFILTSNGFILLNLHRHE